MAYGKRSVKIALDGIAEIIDEISKYTTEENDIKKKKATRSVKVYDLGDQFWESLRDEISRLLVSNYNAVRIMNKPKYQEWKRRARENGISVRVTTSGDEAEVSFIRPALRTGTLREVIRDVQVKNKKINVKNLSSSSIQYSVNISDLFKNYGRRFAKRVERDTGADIFSLTESQINDILERIISQISSKN